jgi:hypothetical protein
MVELDAADDWKLEEIGKIGPVHVDKIIRIGEPVLGRA